MSFQAQLSDGATLDPVHVGHALLDDRGAMLRADAGFAAILRTMPDSLIGRSVLEVTAPDHRRACAVGMANLRATGQPFVVRKQMLRGDDTVIWVEQTTAVSRLADGLTMILATFVPIAAPEARIDPAALLDQARFLRAGRRDIYDTFGSALFANPGWDMLLDAYIVEAEGGAVDVRAIAAAGDIAPMIGARWAQALVADNLLEVEDGNGPTRHRLTSLAQVKIERYLARRLRKLSDLGVLAAR